MLATSQRSLARVLGSAPRYGHEGTGTGIGRGVYLTRGRFSFSTFEHSEPLTVDSLSLTDSTRTPLAASFCCARTDYSSPHAKYLSFQTTTWSNLGSVPVASVIIRRNPSRLFLESPNQAPTPRLRPSQNSNVSASGPSAPRRVGTLGRELSRGWLPG